MITTKEIKVFKLNEKEKESFRSVISTLNQLNNEIENNCGRWAEVDIGEKFTTIDDLDSIICDLESFLAIDNEINLCEKN